MAGEHVILLDEQDQPAGMLEKYAAHTFDTPLHLAFSCWLFNQQGETFEQAVTRRCRFELGVEISDIAPVHPAFRYRAVAPNGIVENEVCPVYAARVVSEVQPNDDEVMDYQWVDLATMLSALAATPWAFSPWMVLEAENRDARQALTDFVARLRG
ncbi:isopentenyl-diphosphate Delta-isomerase [Klebsiella pneumoniae]